MRHLLLANLVCLIILKFNAALKIDKIKVNFIRTVFVTYVHNDRMQQIRFTGTCTTDNNCMSRTVTCSLKQEILNFSALYTDRDVKDFRRIRNASGRSCDSVGLFKELRNRNDFLLVALCVHLHHFNYTGKLRSGNVLLGHKEIIMSKSVENQSAASFVDADRFLLNSGNKFVDIFVVIVVTTFNSLIANENGKDTGPVTVLNNLKHSLCEILSHTRRIINKDKEMYTLRVCFKGRIIFEYIIDVVIAQLIILNIIHKLFHILDSILKLTVVSDNAIQKDICTHLSKDLEGRESNLV